MWPFSLFFFSSYLIMAQGIIMNLQSRSGCLLKLVHGKAVCISAWQFGFWVVRTGYTKRSDVQRLV